jgi:predicted MFS family arabinose efflux permease
MVPLVEGRELGWPVWAFAALAAAVPAMALFVALERRVAERGGSPLVELRLLEAPSFRIGVLSALILYGVISFFFLLSFYLQDGLGLSAIDSGLAFTPLAAAFAASSIGSPRLGARRIERLPQAGAALAAIGLLATITVVRSAGGSVSPELIGALVVVGAGMGMAIPGLIKLSLRAVPPADAGAASGLLTTSQQVGNALGVAIVGTIFFSELGSGTGAAAYGDALSAAVTVQVVLALAAAALVSRARRPSLEPAPAAVID